MSNKRKSRLPWYRRNARIILIVILLLTLVGLLCFPFVSYSQTPTKNKSVLNLSLYPQKYIFNGDTVAVISILQIIKMNMVFNERNYLRTKVMSFEQEIEVLKRISNEKDTLIVSKVEQVKVTDQKVLVREVEVSAMKVHYEAALKEDKRVIRKLRWQKLGLIGVVGVSLYLLIAK